MLRIVRVIGVSQPVFWSSRAQHIFCFSRTRLNTEVFSDLTYNQISTPELTKALIRKPIHNHSQVSQTSLFHKKRVSGQIRTCFSEKKHKVFRKVNKFKKRYYSDVLQTSINVTLSAKAFRCLRKMGSFDTYILCTKPKDLDSKIGEYLRELMLRKINDVDFRVPHVLGSNRKLNIKKYERFMQNKEMKRVVIPKQFKSTFETYQKRFGNCPEELNNADYKKYLELEDLKQTLGDELDPMHPLITELKNKIGSVTTEEEEQEIDSLAAQATEDYLNEKKHSEYKRSRVEMAKKEIQILELKLHEISFQLNPDGNDE